MKEQTKQFTVISFLWACYWFVRVSITSKAYLKYNQSRLSYIKQKFIDFFIDPEA